MGIKHNLYRDEDGENVGSEGNVPKQQHVLEVASSNRCRISPTPVNNDSKKCLKLAIKIKSGIESPPVDFGLVSHNIQGFVRDDRKRKRGNGEERGKRKEEKGEKRRSKRNEEKGEKKSRVKKSGTLRMRDHGAESEIREMWDTILGGNSEDCQAGIRTVDEDNFIDDSGVDPSYHYGSDNEHSPSRASPAEEGKNREIDELFKIGKKKKEKRPSEISLLAKSVVAELNVAAEEDAELNIQEKPAITKLRTLSLLTDIIPRNHLQQDLLHHGVLDALRLWLDPLPDNSIPNITVRSAVFKCLLDITIDLKQSDQRELLKKSDLGKVIMFYYKYDEETKANRELVKELVEKWSRVLFDISTKLEDMRNYEYKRTRRARVPPARKAMSNTTARASLVDDLREPEPSLGRKSHLLTPRQHASKPEAMFMNFVVRPQSKVDPEAVRARAKKGAQNQARAKLEKKLLSGRKRKQQLQAVKLSAEGRGVIKYI